MGCKSLHFHYISDSFYHEFKVLSRNFCAAGEKTGCFFVTFGIEKRFHGPYPFVEPPDLDVSAIGACFGGGPDAIHEQRSGSPESFATRAFAPFRRVSKPGRKATLTTGMTTDRIIFDFRPQRGIIAKTEYPGVAKVVSRLIWVQETGRSSRPTRTKAPRSIALGGLFIVYCGAGFEVAHSFHILL